MAGWGHNGLLSSNLEQSIPFPLTERRDSSAEVHMSRHETKYSGLPGIPGSVLAALESLQGSVFQVLSPEWRR